MIKTADKNLNVAMVTFFQNSSVFLIDNQINSAFFSDNHRHNTDFFYITIKIFIEIKKIAKHSKQNNENNSETY